MNNDKITKKRIRDELRESEIGQSMDITHEQANAIVEEFFNYIQSNVMSGTQVAISGLGRFIPQDKRARPGRNPKTNEEYIIKPRRRMAFLLGGKVRGGLNA